MSNAEFPGGVTPQHIGEWPENLIENQLQKVIEDIETCRIDVGETRKAEVQAKVDGYNAPADTVTDRRANSDAFAATHTQERIGREVDLANLEMWRDFYALLLSRRT